jgi:hypothetical protein
MPQYPKWKYTLDPAERAGYRGLIVDSPDAEDALGSGWADHPDQLYKDPPTPHPHGGQANPPPAPSSAKNAAESQGMSIVERATAHRNTPPIPETPTRTRGKRK